MLRRALLSLTVALVALCAAGTNGQAATVGSTTTYPSGVDRPAGITLGPDGNLWYTGVDSDHIGRLTPTGTATAFALAAGTKPLEIAPGPDGRLWYSGSQTSTIGRITTAGAITEYPLSGFAATAKGITTGPDGQVWFTGSTLDGAKIGRVTTGGVFTDFVLPTATADPTAIAAGADGNLWFTERGVGKIGRITPSGAITEFAVPSGGSPYWLTPGADGNLWFTEPQGNRIGRITPAGVITEFPVPTPNGWPLGIVAAPDGNLWFAEYFGKKIGRITTAGAITEIPVSAAPRGLVPGPGDALWITDIDADTITKLFIGVPAPSLSRPAVDFGTVRTDVPATRSVTLTNAGTGELVLGAVGLSGPDASAFALTGATTCAAGGVLAPGAACDVVLRHAPTAPGSATATLTIADAVSGTPHVLAVSATAVDPPPAATTGTVTAIGTDAATVAGLADPLGAATTVRFQYGTTTDYGTQTDAQDVGAAHGSVAVSARLTGLRPGTTYHVRLVATSARGATSGADATFTTTPAPGGPGPGPGDGGATPGPGPTDSAPRPPAAGRPPSLALLSPARLTIGRAGTVTLRVRCAPAAPAPAGACRGTVALRLRGGRALARTVAFRTTAGRSVATVRVRLQATARARIPRGAGGARVTIALRATDASGTPVRATATRTLRRR